MGRDKDLQAIAALFEGRSQHSALLLRGAAGVGKTALLEAATAQAAAAGFLVLRGTGVECEAQLAFAGLHQVLYPLMGSSTGLKAPLREALELALGMAEGALPDRMAVSTASLELLCTAAQARPLLLVLDDVQWMDRSSIGVLAFIAHRLQHTSIMLLAASRTDQEGQAQRPTIPEQAVEPLADEAAGQLLSYHCRDLAPAVRARVLEEAAGNPLALLELPTLLTDRQRTGHDPLPSGLTPSSAPESLFADRVRTLPLSSRHLLLLAALEESGLLQTVRAGAGEKWDLDALLTAEHAGLIGLSHGRVHFRHPSVRTAVTQLCGAEERRAAHRALAATAVDPERRAWHLGAATVEPDEEVAAALEEAAALAARRGGAASAVSALTHSAGLSPDPSDRVRRLTEAAYVASQSGLHDESRRLLEEAQSAQGNPLDSAREARITSAYLLLHHHGDLNAAHRLLVSALRMESSPGGGSDSIDDTLYILLFNCCWFGGRSELRQAFDPARLPTTASPLSRLYKDALTEPTANAQTVLEGIRHAHQMLSDTAEPWQAVRYGFAAYQIDAIAELRSHLLHIVQREQDAGATASRLAALFLLAREAYLRGWWQEAHEQAQQGLETATATRYPFLAHLFRSQLALLYASRGMASTAHEISDQVTAWAAPRGIEALLAAAQHARTVAVLGDGDHAEAFRLAKAISPYGALPDHAPYLSQLVLDMAEAAVRGGDVAMARAHVAAARGAGVANLSSRSALITAGAMALVAPEDQAGALYEAALSLPEADSWPFERARIQLAHGEWLRRRRDLPRARFQLRSALDTFSQLGAAPWADRARAHLRAAGVSTAESHASQPLLTAQELHIAQLAATGLSNKEIGDRLHLSHRTIATHLYKLYPKLGITSRAALAEALQNLTNHHA
ncbi:AAA family ATPase [Streptomyces krungchingensis]